MNTTNTRQKRASFQATPDMIGKYINLILYTDREPLGKIVGVKSKTILYVQRITTSDNKTKMDFIVGGFAGHCSNNWEQEYDFIEENEIMEIKMTLGRNGGMRICDRPMKYYDYNF
tara:strand:+ start:385 stop:732 length:348 start_codon:yes stop_codon:yes gene_type:complete